MTKMATVTLYSENLLRSFFRTKWPVSGTWYSAANSSCHCWHYASDPHTALRLVDPVFCKIL